MKLTPKKIKKLVKKALKDKPVWKAAKGYKYLEDCEPGTAFEIEGKGARGVLIECTVNAKVIIYDAPEMENDKSILGTKIIASRTEVKQL